MPACTWRKLIDVVADMKPASADQVKPSSRNEAPGGARQLLRVPMEGGNRQWENPRFFGKVKGVGSRFFTRREKTLRSHGRPKNNITVPDAFSVSGRRCRRGRWRSGRDEDLSHVIHFVQESPDEFSLDDCQVPCLKSLLPWSRKQFGSVLPPLASWLVSVRQKLESATVKHPLPPTDWARPADLACECQYCAQLKAFLADPANEVGRIPAREDMRQHLIDIIDRQQCDVKHSLEREGSPYSLVLTKTSGSFERAVKRFEANRRLLNALPIAE